MDSCVGPVWTGGVVVEEIKIGRVTAIVVFPGRSWLAENCARVGAVSVSDQGAQQSSRAPDHHIRVAWGQIKELLPPTGRFVQSKDSAKFVAWPGKDVRDGNVATPVFPWKDITRLNVGVYINPDDTNVLVVFGHQPVDSRLSAMELVIDESATVRLVPVLPLVHTSGSPGERTRLAEAFRQAGLASGR